MKGNKIFFAPSNKFSIRISEFVAFRIKHVFSSHEMLIITLRQNKEIGEVTEKSESKSSGLFYTFISESNYKESKEMVIDYYNYQELRDDIEALKKELRDDEMDF